MNAVTAGKTGRVAGSLESTGGDETSRQFNSHMIEIGLSPVEDLDLLLIGIEPHHLKTGGMESPCQR
jgi:hypothetical protein